MAAAMPRNDPLDPAAVLETLSQVLGASPAPQQDSSAAEPLLRTPHDALAALLHAALTRLDFRLVGFAEDDRIDASSSSAQGGSPNALPIGQWNRSGPESYILRYRHDQSSLTFLLKLLRMSTRVLINASAVEDNKTATIEIPLPDYTSASFFPYPPPGGSAEAVDPSRGRPEPLVNGFISPSRLKDLLLLFKTSVVQKLIPGLRKEGYQEETSSEASGSSSQRPRPTPRNPNSSLDPDDDDLLPPRGAGVYPQRNPLAVGDRDLQPLGGMRPPGVGGFGPPPLFGEPGAGGGGMYVGPDDPIFRDRFRGGAGTGGELRGPWGGDGFLPAGAVPPGARFDPIGPWGGPLPGLGRGAGGLGQGGFQGPPGTNNPANRDPDWDDVRPPRGDNDHNDMFM
ncbi:unnamed protein product [Parajaminaea phylloscopi]